MRRACIEPARGWMPSLRGEASAPNGGGGIIMREIIPFAAVTARTASRPPYSRTETDCGDELKDQIVTDS